MVIQSRNLFFYLTNKHWGLHIEDVDFIKTQKIDKLGLTNRDISLLFYHLTNTGFDQHKKGTQQEKT